MSSQPFARATALHHDTRREAPRLPRAAAAQPSDDARVAGLGRMLRGIGSGLLLAAASTFLLQHWQQGNDLERYACLLGMTLLLSAAGFATGLRLRESKGARTFLALAAGMLPAHFCILGGLVYSQLAWGAGPHPVPGYASWVAPSPAAALLTTALALAALAPVTFVSMLALARSQARLATAASLGLGALLLVPTRDPGAAAALLAVGAAGLAAIEVRVLRRDVALRTFEGLLVRGMLLAPVVLLALRSVLHYELSALFGCVSSASAALLLLGLSRETRFAPSLRRSFERASLVPLAGACVFGGAWLEAAGLPEAAVIPAIAFPYAGALVALSLFGRRRDGGAGMRAAAAALATGAAAANVLLFSDAFASLACLGVSIPTLAYGHALRRRGLVWVGGASAVYALLVHLHAAVRLFAWSGWGGLVLVGLAAILAASLLERHHEAWRAGWRALRERAARGEP